MFCPQCATENELKQSYCRQCGQPLIAVRQAIEGRTEQAIASLKSSKNPLLGGLFGFVIYLIITLLSLFTGGAIGFSNAASAAVLLVLILPFLLLGVIRIWRASRVLISEDDPKPEALPAGGHPGVLNMGKPTLEISATENTTKKLNTPEQKQP